MTNIATVGYILKALQNKMSKKDIDSVVEQLYYYFDVMTVEEAEEYYMNNY